MPDTLEGTYALLRWMGSALTYISTLIGSQAVESPYRDLKRCLYWYCTTPLLFSSLYDIHAFVYVCSVNETLG
jgi:hypothetical protein